MKFIIEISERVISHVKINYMDISDNDRAMMCDAVRTAIPYKERPHGKWRITVNGCECSVCKDTTLTIPMNFCPECGADMRKQGDENG